MFLLGERPIRVAGLLACLALTLASCASTTEPTTASQPTTSTTSGSASTGVRAEDHRPKAFQAVVDATVEKLMVPGAMVLLRTPQGDLSRGRRHHRAGRPDAADCGDTHFRIASNTKTMTAALIVLLAQDGKLKFSDPVSTYVPDVPNGENITIAELLKMRSGLYGYTGAPGDWRRPWTPIRQGVDAAGGAGHRVQAPAAVRARRLLRVQQHQLRAAGPRRREGRRAPAGPAVPGPAVRPARPAADVAARRHRRHRSRRPTRTATCTAEASTRWLDDPYPADMQAASARRERWSPIDYTHQNPSYATAAGGAISTADDLATWMRRAGLGQGLQRRVSSSSG